MASGKQSKRRRHAAAAAVPPPRTARRQASPRVLLAAAGVAVLVVVAIVLAVVLTRGSSGSSGATGTLPEATDVQALLRGIPQHGNVLGSPSARATMIEYVDLQCPYCRQFETEAMPTIVERFVRPGKVKVELRPLAFIGPDSERGRAAAIAAARQNKLFDFAQLLYDNQGTENTGWLSDAMVASAASSIPGLDVAKLQRDKNDASVADAAKKFDEEATAAGVHSTPTILVGRTGSTPKLVNMSSPTDEQAVAKAIQAALG
jgi:protein-disulfide isomerase